MSSNPRGRHHPLTRPALSMNPFVGGCVVSAAPEGNTVAVAGRHAVNETANRLYPTGRRHEEAGGT